MKSQELSEFFSLLGDAKKEKEEEFDNLLKEANIDLDLMATSLFTGIENAKVEVKQQKKKEKKLIESLDNLLVSLDKPKETAPVVVGVPEDFDISDLEEEIVTSEDLEKPEEEVVEETVEENDTISRAIKFIDTQLKEELKDIEPNDPTVDNIKSEVKELRNILYKVLAHGPGSGEVNLLKLDDVDEDTAKVDGKFLKYDSSSGKFIGADANISTDNVAYTGIVTAAQFSGYSHLIAPYASTKTITVKVASKIDGEHRYHGTGSGLGYVLDGVQSPFLTLTPGRTYRFDVSDSSNSGHPFRFYYDAAKATQYTTGVTVESDYVDLEVTDTTPTVLHYQCSAHGYMGNAIQVNSNVVDTPSGGTIRGTLTATAFSGTLTGNVTGDVTGDLTGDVTGDITSSGASQFTNRLQLRSTDGSPARLDFYCEVNNAHYLRLQAPPHAQFSGNPTVVLPNSSGTLLLSDGSGANLTNLPAGQLTGALPAIDGSALTGVGNTDNIRTNTNATFLQNVNVSGTVTATNFIGGGANIISINADNIASGTIDAARIPTLNQNTTGTSAGLTGTPNITVGSVIASTGQFSGNVTIGGTLTYEDVTNIDSVGLVTARSGLVVGTGVTLSKDGDGFYTGIVTATTFVGGLTGNVTGNVSGSSGSTTGNAATATALANARTIAGVSFDGTSDISLNNNAITNGAGYITTSFTNTNQLTNGAGFITASDDITGNAATATILANARTIAGTSFNGSANIDIDFDNLTNKPTIPTNNNQLTNGAAFVTSSIIDSLNASNLSSGTIPNARFPSVLPAIDGSALTGMASTDNVRTGILDVAGISTFRNDIIVGSGITFSPDGNVFTTGVTTATTFVGALTGNVTGTASNATVAISAQGLTGSPNIVVTDVQAVDAIITGNLSVAGTITSLDQNDILATGIITASSGVDLGDPGIVTLSSNTLTTTSSNTDTVASVSATVNRSATFQVQVTRGTEYHVTTINVVHDGTNAFLSEYGTIRTGSILATFDADISGGNLRLRVTPTSTTSTVFKLSKTVIKV